VEEFTLTSTGKFALVMNWSSPLNPYGEIENYQLRILRQDVRTNETSLGALQLTATAETQVEMTMCMHF